jgi:hypothetical protein
VNAVSVLSWLRTRFASKVNMRRSPLLWLIPNPREAVKAWQDWFGRLPAVWNQAGMGPHSFRWNDSFRPLSNENIDPLCVPLSATIRRWRLRRKLSPSQLANRAGAEIIYNDLKARFPGYKPKDTGGSTAPNQ